MKHIYEDMLLESLQDSGLLVNEAKVYLSLLDSGSSTASKIAKKSNLHRPNVYDALQGLIKKGMITYTSIGRGKIYDAQSPSALQELVREKQRIVNQVIPQLELKKKLATSYKHDIFIAEGITSVRNLLTSWLDEKGTILAYGIPKNSVQQLGPFIDQFHKKRITQKKIMKHIYNNNARDRINTLNSLPYTTARVLPEVFDSVVTTLLHNNSVVLIHWLKEILIVHMKSHELAESYKKYFNVLWKIATIP